MPPANSSGRRSVGSRDRCAAGKATLRPARPARPATRVGVIARRTRRDYVPARRSAGSGRDRPRFAASWADGNRESGSRRRARADEDRSCAPVVKAFSLQPAQINGVAVHTGVVGNADIVATPTGIGTTLATSATERLLGLGEFDRVMVVGVAGGVGPSVGIGDVVIPEVVVDGLTGERVPPGRRSTVPRHAVRSMTSDDFIVDPDAARAVDREGRDRGRHGNRFGRGGLRATAACPWSTVRAISDRAEDGDEEMIAMANSDGSPNGKAILRYFAAASRPDSVHAQSRPRRDDRGQERRQDRSRRLRQAVTGVLRARRGPFRRRRRVRGGEGSRRGTCGRVAKPASSTRRTVSYAKVENVV